MKFSQPGQNIQTPTFWTSRQVGIQSACVAILENLVHAEPVSLVNLFYEQKEIIVR